ncbi:catechol 1,2-dioxygenase [Amycolatopsis rhabdoformis]|uniref:Catechol 1,2-dioxygenase n=1 Tax=Amycolatopsis rhabdoformis TaxID=1448059 RepID=A0ABZ1I0Q6_9PSEU|nr:catechol 1,2-dioxygenase [Amycolatopsis rhabdoformis]WSE27386.1 catechol 1,2-dioxygenase [Amycolatopsis rhabdoformis]
MTEVVSPTAAASGASATERFQERAKSSAASDAARVDAIATDALAALHEVVRKHQLTYDEYNAFKAWLIRVGEDGEWPLFLDVFLEHEVEKVANASREGTAGSIEGPYYVEGAPEFGAEATLPMRDGEAGTPLRFFGQARTVSGEPLAGAVVDFWQADDAGLYSQFAPGIPEWNLRGRFTADAEGNFSIHTIHPAPYQIPTDGATGALIAAAGWHAWRPAHLHIKVSAPGHQLITTQLYFDGGEHVGDDIATAVKDALILAPTATGDGEEVRYDFVLDPA